MRIILILWAAPIILFWGWYGLSANNMHFGSLYLSRPFHDQIFMIYAHVLNIPATDIPLKLAWIFVVDTLLILALAAFRWRAKWFPQTLKWVRIKLNQIKADEGTSANAHQVIRDFKNGEQVFKSGLIGPVRPVE